MLILILRDLQNFWSEFFGLVTSLLGYFVFIAAVLLIGPAAMAQITIHDDGFGIVSIGTGWAADIFAILASIAVINPANCPMTDLHISSSSNPGYKTHYGAALMAFAANRQINVVVGNVNCEQSRPRIISVRVLSS